MATYTKRGDAYSVRWRDPDGTNRRRKAPNLKTARQLVREIEETHALGRRWEPEAAGAGPQLVGAGGLIALYLRDRERVLRSSSHRTRSVSLSIFEAWLLGRHRRRHVAPDVLSGDLLGEYWTYMVRAKEDGGRGIAHSTANDRVRDVVRCWEWLRQSRDRRPWVPEVENIDLADQPRPALAAPTWRQMDAAVLAANGWYRKLFMLLRCTGLRKSQAMRLLWEDIDLEARRLHIRGELGKTKQERRGRTVPLAPVLVDDMAGWGCREGWLIEVSGRVRDPHRRVTHAVWKRSGVPRDVWRQPCHAFRHGFISGLATQGVQERIIKRLVGHSLGITGDVYTDPAAMFEFMEGAVAQIPAVCVPSVSELSSGFAKHGGQ